MRRSDQELVRNCLQGDESAWEDFIRSHQRRIFSLSYRFTRCRSEAEDLTQDVFVRVYKTLNSYRGEAGGLSCWLIRVARNLLIDRYREARRLVRFDPIRETVLSVNDTHAPNPLQCLARNETGMRVHAALRRLSPENRNVIVLRELDGLALHEVAAILHVPLGTVKSRLSRGRRELARILRHHANWRTAEPFAKNGRVRDVAGPRRRRAKECVDDTVSLA